MRFSAPINVSAVSLSCGEFSVDKDGCIEVPDDIGTGDLAGLSVNGFTAAPVDEKPGKGKASAPADEQA